MPCETPINSGGETLRCWEKQKTKHVCIVEADESARIPLEGALEKYHEDHIAAKGINSLRHCHLVHKFILFSSIENTGCEGCRGKRMGKIGKKTGMAADESQKQKRSDR